VLYQDFFLGGSINSVEDRGQRERGFGGGSPLVRGEFRPRQTRQLPRAVDLKGRLLSRQNY
jgi:hypothetical protein